MVRNIFNRNKRSKEIARKEKQEKKQQKRLEKKDRLRSDTDGPSRDSENALDHNRFAIPDTDAQDS